MSLSLYFVRHGQTEQSLNHVYCGDLDPNLTEVGEQMATDLAKAYQGVPWQAIYVSPMKRTLATAAPLCQALGLQPQVREGLREISYGRWEGQTVDWVKAHYGEDYVRWLTEPAWNPPTDGETAVQVASRAATVIAEIEHRHTQGNVLVVAHKATIRIILCSLLGIDLGRFRDRIDMPVASVSLVKFDVHGPLLQRLGDRTHLRPSLQDLPGT